MFPENRHPEIDTMAQKITARIYLRIVFKSLRKAFFCGFGKWENVYGLVWQYLRIAE